MPVTLVWQRRPVFVTSTFRDMQAERDVLRNTVFPQLEERLRERRHHLEPIDLRWGVETVDLNDEVAKDLLVLKVCLAEIERSRPFQVVLLGDRYGWVPPEERMQAAVEEAGFETDVRGKSVTALEIEFGVLGRAEQQQRCFFYFRQGTLPYDQMPAGVAAEYSDAYSLDPETRSTSPGRLAELKGRIEDKLASHVRHYAAQWDSSRQAVTCLDAWADQVVEDLWEVMDRETREYVRLPEPTWQDEERWVLEQFVENRGRGFIGRADLTEELMELALGSDDPHAGRVVTPYGGRIETRVDRDVTTDDEQQPWGACATGVSGSGKSALFAHLYRQLEGEDVVLLSHAVGISVRSTQVEPLLRRWVQELSREADTGDPLTEESGIDEIEEAFGRLLSQVSAQRRVVVLVDALNEFEPTPRGQHLTWLPKLMPPNVRFIATTIPGKPSETLERRPGVGLVQLPRLDENEAAEIARAVCARYHRQISSEVLDELLAKLLPDGTAAASVPLWLELALDELNLLDADDFARAEREFGGTPEQRLHLLAMDVARRLPAEVSALYGRMLERCEQLAGHGWAWAFANVIAVTRNGLRESDLSALLPKVLSELGTDALRTPESEFLRDRWDGLRFAALRRAFRAHLVQRGALGQWDFFHDQMRDAVKQRYHQGADIIHRLHSLIADHLESLPSDDPLRQTELMFHLIGSDDRLRAARYYAGDLAQGEQAGATAALAQHVLAEDGQTPNRGLEWVVSLLGQQGLASAEAGALCYRFSSDLLDVLRSGATLGTRLVLLRSLEPRVKCLLTHEQTAVYLLWNNHSKIGAVLQTEGDLVGALAAHQESLALAKLVAASDPTDALWQYYASMSHARIGAVLQAQGDLVGALTAYRGSLVIAERLVTLDPSRTEWQQNLAIGHGGIGDVLVAQGDGAGALSAYRECHAILERLAAAEPNDASLQPGLAMSRRRIGDVCRARGDGRGALSAYRESLAIAEHLSATDPDNASWQEGLSASHSKVGDVLWAQGDAAGALTAYREALAIEERLAAADPSDAYRQHNLGIGHERIGSVLQAQGDLNEAHSAFERKREITERLATAAPSNAEWQWDLTVSQEKLGDVLVAQGDGAGALTAYRASYATLECLAASDPSNEQWQSGLSVSHKKIGDVLATLGDGAGALTAYRKALAIAERLAASDSRNASRQRDLSTSQERIGDALMAQGDGAGALTAYRKALAIAERLAASDPSNAELQQDLAATYHRLGAAHQSTGDRPAAEHYLRRCHETLRGMRDAGMPLDPEAAEALAQLESRPTGPVSPLSLPATHAHPAETDSGPPASGDSATIVAQVQALLDEDKLEEAVAFLETCSASHARVTNASGVCQLRLGETEEAIRLFRKTIDEWQWVDAAAEPPPVLKGNLATALLVANKVSACVRLLDEIDDEQNPTVQKLRSAIRNRDKGLTLWQKILREAGLRPEEPIVIDFTPGELF